MLHLHSNFKAGVQPYSQLIPECALIDLYMYHYEHDKWQIGEIDTGHFQQRDNEYPGCGHQWMELLATCLDLHCDGATCWQHYSIDFCPVIKYVIIIIVLWSLHIPSILTWTYKGTAYIRLTIGPLFIFTWNRKNTILPRNKKSWISRSKPYPHFI